MEEMTEEKVKYFMMEYKKEDGHIVVYNKEEKEIITLHTVEQVTEWLKKYTNLHQSTGKV